MAIKILDGVEDSYNKFSSGTSENTLYYVLLFWSIESHVKYMNDFGTRSQIKTNKKTDHNVVSVTSIDDRAMYKQLCADMDEANKDMEAKKAKFWLIW